MVLTTKELGDRWRDCCEKLHESIGVLSKLS